MFHDEIRPQKKKHITNQQQTKYTATVRNIQNCNSLVWVHLVSVTRFTSYIKWSTNSNLKLYYNQFTSVKPRSLF